MRLCLKGWIDEGLDGSSKSSPKVVCLCNKSTINYAGYSGFIWEKMCPNEQEKEIKNVNFRVEDMMSVLSSMQAGFRQDGS